MGRRRIGPQVAEESRDQQRRAADPKTGDFACQCQRATRAGEIGALETVPVDAVAKRYAWTSGDVQIPASYCVQSVFRRSMASSRCVQLIDRCICYRKHVTKAFGELYRPSGVL